MTLTARNPAETFLIVLIDDNRADNIYHRLVIEETLPDAEILTVNGGKAALERLERTGGAFGPPPDLILLDLNMPAMTGWECIERYQASGQAGESKPVMIVLSTSENPDEVSRAASHPAVDGFISKPLNTQRLDELLARYFGR